MCFFSNNTIFLSITSIKLTILFCSFLEGILTSNFERLFLLIPNTDIPLAIILIFVLRLLYPQFANIKMIVPSVKEQEKIAIFLNKIDNKIELLEKRHKYYQEFKKYLMQQIFAQKLR